MERVASFDVSLKDYDKHQIIIEKLYPGQYLDLEIITKPNGFEEVQVKSNLGVIGELFSEDGFKLVEYLKDTKQYYIETSFKKHYIKEGIKLVVVVIIEVFKKDEKFTQSNYPFLGNYITNFDKYVFGGFLGEDTNFFCTVTDLADDVQWLDEYALMLLRIQSNVVEVFRIGSIKIGELSKKTSARIIPYMQNGDYDVEARVKSFKEKDDGDYSCRLEIFINKKKYLKKSIYLTDRSLLIEGIELIDDDGRSLSNEDKQKIQSSDYSLEKAQAENHKKNKIENIKKEEEAISQLRLYGILFVGAIINGIAIIAFDAPWWSFPLFFLVAFIYLPIEIFFQNQRIKERVKNL